MLLEQIAGTDVWFRTYRMRCDARFTYKLAENLSPRVLGSIPAAERGSYTSQFVSDPLNRRGDFETLMGRASIAELPNAPPQPLIRLAAGVNRGVVQEVSFPSAILENQRSLWIYTPPGYTTSEKDIALMIVFDGDDRHYSDGSYFPIPTILDNLIGQARVPRMIAVMIGNAPGARQRELSCWEPFDKFLTDELLPMLRSRYSLRSASRSNVIAGASLGGAAAVCSAMQHPDLFPNVLVQSGAFAMSWPQMRLNSGLPTAPGPGELFTSGFPEAEWIARQFVQKKKLPLRFYVEVGLMEDTRWNARLPFFAHPSTTLAARHFRDVLEAKGYTLIYHEYNGAHEALSWRGTFGDALAGLVGRVKK